MLDTHRSHCFSFTRQHLSTTRAQPDHYLPATMPFLLRNGSKRPLFPHSNANSSQQQKPLRRQVPSPQQPSDDRYYFQRPLHCDDHMCYTMVLPRLGLEDGSLNHFMTEQWKLAAGSRPDLASQYMTSSAILAAREQKYNWLTLVEWFFGLFIGSGGSTTPGTLEPETPHRSLIEMVLDFFCFIANMLGYIVAQSIKSIKKVDWDRVWKVLAFFYVAYIWGRREEERFKQLGSCRSPLKTEIGGLEYRLVEDVQAWCKSSQQIWKDRTD